MQFGNVSLSVNVCVMAAYSCRQHTGTHDMATLSTSFAQPAAGGVHVVLGKSLHSLTSPPIEGRFSS